MTEQMLLEQVVLEVLGRMEGKTAVSAPQPAAKAPPPVQTQPIDVLEPKPVIGVADPVNERALVQMQESTPARIAIGRAGPRLRTATYLKFRADHASARDAVTADVSGELIERLGLFSVDSKCISRDEHLTRPDLGRQLSDEAVATLKSRCTPNPTVQIYVSDGLSSTAVEAGAPDCLPALNFGLSRHGLNVGTPFFMRYGRVPAMDAVTELLGAEVTCVLIGERPGLATADSMSAYIAYRATVGMPEARRTVVSNIHWGGLPAVEAGAYIADVIQQMLQRKASGVDLKL